MPSLEGRRAGGLTPARGCRATLYAIATAPLIDGPTKSSWEEMSRRTKTLFDREVDFDSASPEIHRSGEIAVFLRELQIFLAAHSPSSWQVTLIGHSMGAIVTNQIVRQFPQIHFDNLVYMAAACSIRDYEDSVFPYLRRQRIQPTAMKKTMVYHLTLHEGAERANMFPISSPIPLMPGSLLVWIDSFLTNPATPEDRTLGRYANFFRAFHNTDHGPGDDLRPQIRFKSFDWGARVSTPIPRPMGICLLESAVLGANKRVSCTGHDARTILGCR